MIIRQIQLNFPDTSIFLSTVGQAGYGRCCASRRESLLLEGWHCTFSIKANGQVEVERFRGSIFMVKRTPTFSLYLLNDLSIKLHGDRLLFTGGKKVVEGKKATLRFT